MNLFQNPFYLLGATARDDRRRLVELADFASLSRDPSVCTKARADLSNPRSRLAAEVAWLPAVSPRQVAELIQTLQYEPAGLVKVQHLPALARANLIASSLQCLGGLRSSDGWVEWSLALAAAFEDVEAHLLLTQINEDRAVAGFPAVSSDDALASEVLDRRRFFKTVLRDKLDQMPTESLIAAVTNALDVVTAKGTRQAPMLLDDLVDSYEVETKQFLDKEAANANQLIAAVRKAAAAKVPVTAIEAQVSQLEHVIWNWHRVAQPIQLSRMARGLEHSDSVVLGRQVRSLAVDLFNEHNLLALSERLSKLLNEVFAEVSKVQDQVQQDLSALHDIRTQRDQLSTQAEEARIRWAQEISFEADIGLLFKKKFRISEDGIYYGDFGLTLDQITVARWGGTRHSVNGIPTGTTYEVAFGNAQYCPCVKLPNKELFSTVTDKLWKAVGIDIINRMLQALKTGGYLSFPGANIADEGLSVAPHRKQKTYFPWGEVAVGSGGGCFVVGPASEPNRRVQLSYLAVNNVHFLEAILRTFFNEPKARRLSDLIS